MSNDTESETSHPQEDTQQSSLVLSFTEKILRSNTNNTLSIPNLSYINYVLTQVALETDVWEFELVVKSGGNELVKLSPAFFKHHRIIDLSPHSSKVSDGDKMELVVKPKHSHSDIKLNIQYTYTPNGGTLYYQNTIKLTDLEDPTCPLMSEITQHMRPTRMEIKVEGAVTMSRATLRPKFKSDDFSGETYEYTKEFEPTNKITIDFTEDGFPDGVLNLLQYYRLELKLHYETQKKENLDTPIHFLVYGFKVI